MAIETHGLGKRYGDVRAVEHLSLRVAEGEIYAFLGLNGAGKTTTIRMLLGMIKPTSGYAMLLQTKVRLGNRQPWASVGYLVEIPHAYPELTVRENLEVARRLHPGVDPKAISQMIERLGLAAYADWRAATLSQGNAQRLGLAKALLHSPRLLILDEPSLGLDPAGIVEIRELLLELTRERGVTVFMSSHILAEVSRLAGRIGIIHQGRLLQELNADELERNRYRRLLLRARDVEAAYRALIAAGQPAEILPGVSIELRIQRASILLAKFIVVAAWAGVMTLLITGFGLVVGALIGLPGGSPEVILEGSLIIVTTACLVIMVVLPFALLASVGRGYLLPLGTTVLILIMANLMVILGWAEYFPWAAPMLYAQGEYPLPPESYWLVVFTGIAGMIATYLWWKNADQNR